MRRIILLLGSYDVALHRGIAEFAREHGWHLDLSLLKKLEFPNNYAADGILSLLTDNKALETFAMQAGLPTVDLSVWRKDLPFHRVTADNEAIGRLGAQHLLEHGHSQFLFYSTLSNRVSDLRWKGFSETLHHHGLHAERLVDVGESKLIATLEQAPKPLAVMGNSDLDASEVASLCATLELSIPGEVAILGVDNNPLICECQAVPLSSVELDFARIGYEGARMLNGLISAGKDQPLAHTLIEPDQVEVRQSTSEWAVQDPLIRRAIDFIQENLHRSIGTQEICEALDVSRRTLETRFKAAVRGTIHGLIQRLRMERAETLLIHGGEPIEHISAQLGFCNAAHFSRSFKAYSGSTPSTYRSTGQHGS